MQPPPAGQVLIVKQNGETFYADPDTIHNQVYTGYRVQYQAYKQAQLLASRQNPALNVHPDPHGVVVNEFDGWVPGPLAPIDGYPAGAGNKVYVGRQAQYNTYKQLLAAQKAKMASANAAAAAQPNFVEETAGPGHIEIESVRWLWTAGNRHWRFLTRPTITLTRSETRERAWCCSSPMLP